MTDDLISALEDLRDSFLTAAKDVDNLIAEGKLRLAGLAEIPVTDLGNGWRIVDGELLYSAAWLDDGAEAAKRWLDSRGEAA